MNKNPHLAAASILFISVLSLWLAMACLSNQKAVIATDTYGYLQSAELISKQGFLGAFLRDPLVSRLSSLFPSRDDRQKLSFFLAPWSYYVHDFENGILYNYYPPGFPYLLSMASGFISPYYFNTFMALLFALVLFYYFRRLGGWAFALFSIASMLFTYDFLKNSVMIMSDIPSLILAVASLLLLNEGLARSSPLMLIISGAAGGYSISVRYANIIILAPVAYVFIKRLFSRASKRTSSMACFLTGFVISLAPLLLYLYRLFGMRLQSTYYGQDIQFRICGFFGQIALYFLAITKTMGIAGALLALIGMALFLIKKNKDKTQDVLETVFALGAAYLVFYSFYYANEPRFILPMFFSLSLFYAYGAWFIYDYLNRRNLFLACSFAVIFSFYPMLNSANYLIEKKAYWNAGIGYSDWLKPAAREAGREIKAEIASQRSILFRDYLSKLSKMKTSRGIGLTVDTRLLCDEIRASAGINGTVIFCNDLSGPLRLYANITTYKFLPEYEKYLIKCIGYQEERGYRIYIYTDKLDEQTYLEDLKKSGKLSVYEMAGMSKGTLSKVTLSGVRRQL